MTSRVRNDALYDQLLALLGFKSMGLANSRTPGTLTFLDSHSFIGEIAGNKNIVGIVTRPEFLPQLAQRRPDIKHYSTEDPRFSFYTAYNAGAARRNAQLGPSEIHPTAIIHERAYVASTGVFIGANVVIEPMVAILPGVKIGKNSMIRAGSMIGVEGFEHKRIGESVLSVIHDRRVIIGEDVEIGANNTIARGLMGEDTEIGNQTKTDCLVHIAHCARIGERCLVPAAAMIAGSASIGNDVWVGPNASVSSQVSIGDGAFVTIGAVVVKDVPPQGRVSGNFAMPHREFVRAQSASRRPQKDEGSTPC